MLIAIEGIDGSGKGTQAQLLKEKVQSLGMSAEVLSFPRYGKTLFAQCIAAYLNGEFGDITSVTPHSAALLYAGDRFESLTTIIQLSQSHDVLILDRYIASNLAHQAAKLNYGERQDFISWLSRIEYEIFGLPKTDFTLYLDMPVELASELIHKKKQRNYTEEVADIHERDLQYLAVCRVVYQVLVNMNFDSRWISIQCARSDGRVQEVSDIHNAIWNALRDAISIPDTH